MTKADVQREIDYLKEEILADVKRLEEELDTLVQNIDSDSLLEISHHINECLKYFKS